MKNTFIYLTVFLLLSLGCKKEVLYTLNVTVTPSGSGTTSVTSGTYQAGQTVSITATPSPEYIFKDWSGSVNSTNNPLSFMIDSTKSIIANFEKRQYPLSLTIEGSGVVKEEIVLTQAMVGSYPSGTTVKLTAVPDSGSVFDSWSGDTSLSINPITLKISKPYSITAKFVEKIKFATNLDTGIYNVSDTLLLKISIISKLPPTGVLVSITSTWTDSSKQIFKLDTTTTQSNLNLNIPGHKKTGNYSLFISTTSKSTATNTSNKTIKFINDPLGRFTGYKVDLNAKQLGRSYWENIPYPADLFCSVFQKSTLQSQEVQTNATSWGDFNSDGYMDIFNAGGSYDGIIRGSASFIIWNKEKKIFEERNLFNDKSIKIIGGNAHTVIPKYFNNDDYLDLLIIDNGDEGQLIPGKDEPIKIVLSDGKGGYDVKEILTTEYDSFFKIMNQRKMGGDIGDLNGDGLDDLFIACNSINYIFWGIPQFPFFKKDGRIFFASDFNNPIFNNEVGMSSCSICADHTFGAKIEDIDTDGKNDIIAFGEDRVNSYHQRIFFNKKNNGIFSNQDIIKLPLNHPIDKKAIQHLIVDDFNGDGKKDIFYLLNEMTGDKYEMRMYLQNENNNFEIDKTWSDYVSYWGPTKMMHNDINGDGEKDISFLDAYGNQKESLNNNRIYNKKVLIRKGNRFETIDAYKFDLFSKYIRDKYFK